MKGNVTYEHSIALENAMRQNARVCHSRLSSAGCLEEILIKREEFFVGEKSSWEGRHGMMMCTKFQECLEAEGSLPLVQAN